MLTFQDLSIHGVQDFNDYVSQCPQKNHWIRDEETENKIRAGGCFQYCFKYVGTELPEAYLCVVENDDDNYCVSNITPVENDGFTKTVYNKLLNNWKNEYLDDYSKDISVSNPEIPIKTTTSEKIAELFYSFSRCANKSTGHSHPNDEKRWFKFIYECVFEGKSVETDLLAHTLKEDGWDDCDKIDELVRDYEYTISAMKFCSEREHERL